MVIRLIASDMDGTFLNADGTYDKERFIKILDELEMRNIHFVVATGNGMKRMETLFEGLTPRLDFIAENGGHLVTQQQTLVRKSIPKEFVKSFLDYFKGKEIEYVVSVSCEEKTYLMEGAVFPILHPVDAEQRKLFLEQLVHLANWDGLPEIPVYKLNVIIPEKDCDHVLEEFNQNFAGRLWAVTSGYGMLDILLDGIHKGWGMNRLLDYYGLKSDQVMAFGDNDNDLEMLKLVGESYAMENASDQVKAASKHIAPNHQAAGVLTVIEEFLRGE